MLAPTRCCEPSSFFRLCFVSARRLPAPSFSFSAAAAPAPAAISRRRRFSRELCRQFSPSLSLRRRRSRPRPLRPRPAAARRNPRRAAFSARHLRLERRPEVAQRGASADRRRSAGRRAPRSDGRELQPRLSRLPAELSHLYAGGRFRHSPLSRRGRQESPARSPPATPTDRLPGREATRGVSSGTSSRINPSSRFDLAPPRPC